MEQQTTNTTITNNSFLDALNALDGEFEEKPTNPTKNNELEEKDVYPEYYDDFDVTMEISLGDW